MQIINEQSHSLKFLSEIQELAKPLHALGIIHFKFTLFLQNNQRITFCNDPNWLIHFYEQDYHLVGSFDVNPFTIEQGQYIWDHLPGTDASPIVRCARDDYSFAHGFSIVKQNKDTVSMYDFAAHKDNPAINSIYLHSFDCIEQFVHYFNDNALPLIDKARLNPLQVQARETMVNLRDLQTTFDKETFLKNTKVKHFYFRGESASYYLTPRELDCFRLLNEGYSQKQVAHLLKLSPRTVEHYIAQAKERCDCTGVKQLQLMVKDLILL